MLAEFIILLVLFIIQLPWRAPHTRLSEHLLVVPWATQLVLAFCGLLSHLVPQEKRMQENWVGEDGWFVFHLFVYRQCLHRFVFTLEKAR